MRTADKLLDDYGADCQVGLISREHRNARKFLGTSCEFLIFLLDLYSKQVRLIHSLFYCMPAGSNLQRLKSAEMKKHIYSNISEQEIERERSQRKILNSGILTWMWQNEPPLWYLCAIQQRVKKKNVECCELAKSQAQITSVVEHCSGFYISFSKSLNALKSQWLWKNGTNNTAD